VARKWLKPDELFILGTSTEAEEEMLVDLEATGSGSTLANKRRAKGLHRNWKECSLIASLLVTLQIVGTFPFFIQKMMVRFVQPFFYGGMVNVFQIVFANIVYTVIFVLILVVFIAWFGFHFILQKKKQKRRVGVTGRRSDAHGLPVPIATAEMIPISPSGLKHSHHHHHHHHHKKLLEEQQQPLISKNRSLSKEDSKDESGEDNALDDDAKKEANGLDPIPEKHHKHKHHHHRHSGDKEKDKDHKEHRKHRSHHKKEGEEGGEESKGDDLQEDTDDEMNPTDKSKKEKKVFHNAVFFFHLISFFASFRAAFLPSFLPSFLLFRSIVIVIVTIILKKMKYVILKLMLEVIAQLTF
jgi:cation transport ATPase